MKYNGKRLHCVDCDKLIWVGSTRCKKCAKRGSVNSGQFKKGGVPWIMGKTHSDVTKKKLSIAGKGRIPPNFKGDEVGYFAVHSWIHRHYGKANHCSFDPTHTSHHFEWANISGSYLRDVDDYAQLCIKCHRQYDMIRNGYRIGKHTKGVPWL